MAPATRSVHRVLAIDSKTHFAKDVFRRLSFARLTWHGQANVCSDATIRAWFQIAPFFLSPEPTNSSGALPCPSFTATE
jgi:hypothetical protein